MSWKTKFPLDYSANGDDIDTFAQKYMSEISTIYALLNRLRTLDSSAGTTLDDVESFQFKINQTTSDILVRNATNDAWIILGKLAANFGITPQVINAIKGAGSITVGLLADRPISVNSTDGDMYIALEGDMYYFTSGAWKLILTMNVENLNNYSKLITTDMVSVANAANKILKTDAEGKVDASVKGTAQGLAGYPLDITNIGDGKVIAYSQSKGKLYFETAGASAGGGSAVGVITGRENSKVYAVGAMVYSSRLPSGTFLTAVQAGTSSEFQPDYYNPVNGLIVDGSVLWRKDTLKGVNLQVNSDAPLNQVEGDLLINTQSINPDGGKNAVLKIKVGESYFPIYLAADNTALIESTGYGVISGFNASHVGYNITVAAGIAHMPNGARYDVGKTLVTVAQADATNPRIDLIYLSTAGVVSYLAGIAAVNPTVPSVPVGGLALHKVLVGIDGTVTLTDLRVFKARYQNRNLVNIYECQLYGNETNDDTVALQNLIDANLNQFKGILDGGMSTGKKYKVQAPVVVDQSITKLSDIYISNFGAGTEAIHVYTKIPLGEDLAMMKNINTWERLIIDGKSTGNGIYVGSKTAGDSAGFSGAGFSLRDSKIMRVRKGIILGENAHMCNFDNVVISYAEDCCIDVGSIGANLLNAGEAIVFNNCRFFNNNGAIVKSENALPPGTTLIFNNCSFDYSAKAISIIGAGSIYRGLRVICNNCHFETSAAKTTAEYFNISADAELVLNDCEIVLTGDWGNKNIMVNTNGFVYINRGILNYQGYTISYKKPRLSTDLSSIISADGITKVNGLKFENSQSILALGKSQNLITDNPLSCATVIGTASQVTVDANNVLTITGLAGSWSGVNYKFPCKAGDIVIPYFKYKGSSLVAGDAAWKMFNVRISYLDANGNELYFVPFLSSNNPADYLKSNEDGGVHWYACVAPQGASYIQMILTMQYCTGNILLQDISMWII